MHFDPGQFEKWRRRRTVMLFAVAFVGAHLAFEGLHATKGFGTSLELALVTTLFHTFSWMFLYEAVPRAAAGQASAGRGALLVLVGFVAAAGIIATATFYSWVGVAAAPSQRKHFMAIIEDGTTVLAELRDARQREQELKPVLSQTSDSILQLAQDEEKHGALSTKNNKGPFTMALYGLSSAYADAAAILEKDDVAAQENFAEAERILATMRTLHAEASAHDDRVEDVNARFAEAALRLNRLLSELKKSPLRSALTVVRKSDTTIAFLPARRDAPGETAAKGALIKLASESKARIDQLAEGADRTFLKVPRFQTLSREEAAIQYIADFPQYPIYCLTIDLILPLIGLLAALFFAPFRRATEHVPTTRAVEEDDAEPQRPERSSTTLPNRDRIVEALRRGVPRSPPEPARTTGATNGARA